MEIISSRLIVALGQMGLSHHDAKVYASLVYFNSCDAKQLIDFIQISKPSVYESLQRLQDYGLVTKKIAKPAIFIPVSPRIAIDILIRENVRASEIAFQELDTLSRSRKETDEEDAIMTVYGEKSVDHKIREMLKSSKEKICCVMGEKYLPLFSDITIRSPITMHLITHDPESIGRAEKMLRKHRVALSLIAPPTTLAFGPPSERQEEVCKFFRPENGFELIVDDRETISIPPLDTEKTTGLYSLNEVIVLMTKDRIRRLIGQNPSGQGS